MKTRFVYDTEFIEDGRTIDLISIGIVREDGEPYHAVSADMPMHRIRQHKWLMENVVPFLPTREIALQHKDTTILVVDTEHALVKPRKLIAKEVFEFLTSGEHEPELWAFYSAYDHVALAQLWGPMAELPSELPKRTRDLADALDTFDGWDECPVQREGNHEALADARHDLEILRYIDRVAKPLWLLGQGIS